MDSEIKGQKSLPPLVKGKIHGYLKLVIDEVIWSEKNFQDIKIFASWWGETISAQFRPVDITKNVTRSEYETTEIYAIRTSINLFQEYVKNCECIELTIISEENNIVIGTSRITNLLDFFDLKPCFEYVPIINECGNKIAEIHVFMKLEHVDRSPNMQVKSHQYVKENVIDKIVLGATNDFEYPRDVTNNTYNVWNKSKPQDSEIYKSILKSRRMRYEKPLTTANKEIMDQVVAQIVARAQRLRGAILRETYNKDVCTDSNKSLNATVYFDVFGEDNVKSYDYIMDAKTITLDENEALCTAKLTSPTSSCIDFTANDFTIGKHGKQNITLNNTSSAQTNFPLDEILLEEKLHKKPKEILLLNHVNSIRIFVESFTLTPAGYRRVKSSSLSHHDNISLSVTYVLQYNMIFDHVRTTGKKLGNNNKSVRVCSKKQIDQEIYFNHDSIYEISKLKSHTEYFIRYKVLVRHRNKKSLTELGAGTMYVSDIIKSENWSIAQCIIIVNKGIKIGELNVIAELGSDFIHFGKQYIDDIICSKENIPALRIQRQLSQDKSNKKSKSATDVQSESNSQVPSISTQKVDCVTADNDLLASTGISHCKTENTDNIRVDVKSQENYVKEKVLLQGLIYISEGKELSEVNTYLVCRAFWKEDKSKSQICSNTKNPFYQFCQLVPVVHSTDLLDRIKDNYIIIEVYYRNNNNVDNLLGLTKLSMHQLYVAYRDPCVLPHLLLSKYPVVSVDEWVQITDPITSQSHGELLALVALGTAEQIALLETSRNLRNTRNKSSSAENVFGSIKHLEKTRLSVNCNSSELQRKVEIFSQDKDVDSGEKKKCSLNFKTQECQTDISTIRELKFRKESQLETNSEDLILYTLMDRLTEVLSIDKSHANNKINLKKKKEIPTSVGDQMCINDLNFHNSYDESDNGSVKHSQHVPTGMYRSVGVGAEYVEEVDQQLNIDYSSTIYDLPSATHRDEESMNSVCSQTMFRAVVEIECALHLPKVEKINETIEPSTYVSFRTNKCDPLKQLHSHMISDVFPHSCNPKWNWKCDVKLPVELLLHAEKRLIIKIWRLLDTDTSVQINLEQDIVIGFSAIDLSVLISGFPTVSGWFHVMDFAGKCNGQIKVSITPLDNLSLFGKSTSSLSTTRISTYNVCQSNWFPLNTHETHSGSTEKNTLSIIPVQEEVSKLCGNQLTDSVSQIGSEDVSMSFLSLSLKKKLTELDEITKRLESRLHDVTNTAFEDYFESEFDVNEPNNDIENNDYKSTDTTPVIVTNYNDKICEISQLNEKLLEKADVIVNENKNTSTENEFQNWSSKPLVTFNKTNTYGETTPGSCNLSKSYSKQILSNGNCQMQHGHEHLTDNIEIVDDNFSKYPQRGTRTHISYLLDKLSLQLPSQTHLTATVPTRKNSTDLLPNLPENDNGIQNSNISTEEFKACTMLRETENVNNQNIQTLESYEIICSPKGNKRYNARNLSEVSAQSQNTNRMSTVIREELTADENNDTSKCDNDLNNIFNPLLYQHLVPDPYYSNTPPEEEAIEQLDNRYTKTFVTSVDNTLSKVRNLEEIGASSSVNTELFKMTPPSVSENIDNNVNLTVLHEASYTDLLASNSTESTTTLSPGKTSVKQIDDEMTERSYSTSSRASDLVLSRQAPDGGNPMEDVTKQAIFQQNNDVQDLSPNSCN